jgi:hypothetical protein
MSHHLEKKRKRNENENEKCESETEKDTVGAMWCASLKERRAKV